MAKKKSAADVEPGVLIPVVESQPEVRPLLPAVSVSADEVSIVLADDNGVPQTTTTIQKDALAFTITLGTKAAGDKRFYAHTATDELGRWIFTPTR